MSDVLKKAEQAESYMDWINGFLTALSEVEAEMAGSHVTGKSLADVLEDLRREVR